MNNNLEKYLRCPLCFSKLEKNKIIICSKSKHQFQVEQDIPILLDLPNLPIHSQNQKAHFEKNRKIIDFNSVINIKQHELQYLERFTENFKRIKNKIIIEVGTGNGYMAIGLAKLGAKVVATDITVKNLIHLKKIAKTLKLENNLLFVCCSADSLPIKSDSFNYFIINAVLEHIPAERKAINEIKRVLIRGGGLMITVPISYKYIFPPFIPINFYHDKKIGHLRRYDISSLKNKFPGFKIIKTYFTGHPLKVAKVIINMVSRIFDEKKIEEEDKKLDKVKMWSSNLIAFLVKK